MTTIAQSISDNAATVLPVGGLVIGMLFGALVTRTNFCTMGAISDYRALGDGRRLRAWLLAVAVAIAGTQALAATGTVALDKSMYLTPGLNWLGNVLGGALFGYGMVYAGGCASRNLARVGGGDLRSLVTLLLIGLFAYITIGGVLGPLRAAMERATSIDLAAAKIASQSLGDIVSGFAIGGSPGTGNLLIGLLIAGLLAIYCFADREFRGSPRNIAAGLGVGMLVVAGWALTGMAFDELADRPVSPISLTFVRPIGDTTDWLTRFTALGLPGFGVTTVIGVILGSFLASVATGRFRLQSFADAVDARRNMGGAALMGVGGVMAMGCTMGQAVTGLSTLALGAVLTTLAIVAGAYVALGRLERSL